MKTSEIPTAKNALFLIANDAYAPGFLVTFASALISSNLDDFNIYIGHAKNESIDNIWETVIQLCERFKFPVERCQRVKIDLDKFKGFAAHHYDTHYTYGRVAIAEMLEEPILIILDSDMVVLDDLSKTCCIGTHGRSDCCSTGLSNTNTYG